MANSFIHKYLLRACLTPGFLLHWGRTKGTLPQSSEEDRHYRKIARDFNKCSKGALHQVSVMGTCPVREARESKRTRGWKKSTRGQTASAEALWTQGGVGSSETARTASVENAWRQGDVMLG